LRVDIAGTHTTTNDVEPNPHASQADPLTNVFINGGRCPVHTVPAGPGVAVYDSQPLAERATMIGATRLTVDYTASTAQGVQLNARLYDVFPDGTQVLVDRGPYRVPLKALVEGGQRSDGDRHVLAIDRSRCLLYELYRAFFRKRPKPPRWNADSGVIWDLRSPRLRTDGFTSADAAGLPVFPGLVRFDEAQAGEIRHAIRVTFSSTRDAWIHPASHCAGDSSSPNAPPMGLRLRLGEDYPLAGLSGQARAIAVALKRYGLIVADNGSNWFFSGSSDRRWDDEDLNQLKEIPGSAFEVVRSAAAVHDC
jgi:hypothetical protein